MTTPDRTTALLHRWSAGCPASAETLMERLYPDLRDLAGRHGWRLRPWASPSDLAQDLCLSLLRQDRASWHNRRHFFAVAAKLVRRIAADRCRSEGRLKRTRRVELRLEDDVDAHSPFELDHLALDLALDQLARASPSAVRVVELRYFAGLSIDETAAVLDVGRTTVVRRWRFARAWLRAALDGVAPELGES